MATILVGTDGSKRSEAALSEGFDLAKRLGAKVLVVAVAAHVSDRLGGSVHEGRVSEHLNRARTALDAARTMAEEAGVRSRAEVEPIAWRRIGAIRRGFRRRPVGLCVAFRRW